MTQTSDDGLALKSSGQLRLHQLYLGMPGLLAHAQRQQFRQGRECCQHLAKVQHQEREGPGMQHSTRQGLSSWNSPTS